MSVEVSIVKRQLADAKGSLSYAPTAPAVLCIVLFATQSSVARSMAAVGSVATAVPALGKHVQIARWINRCVIAKAHSA